MCAAILTENVAEWVLANSGCFSCPWETLGERLSTDLKAMDVLGDQRQNQWIKRRVSPEGRTPEGRLLLSRIMPTGRGRVSLPSLGLRETESMMTVVFPVSEHVGVLKGLKKTMTGG